MDIAEKHKLNFHEELENSGYSRLKMVIKEGKINIDSRVIENLDKKFIGTMKNSKRRLLKRITSRGLYRSR